MPKKKRAMTPEEQSESFRKAVRELEAAGELNPTEADDRFERTLRNLVPIKKSGLIRDGE